MAGLFLSEDCIFVNYWLVKLFENKCLVLFHFRQTLSIYVTWRYNKPTTYIKCRWPGFFLTRQDAKIQVYQLQTSLVRSLTFNGLLRTKAATYSYRKKSHHHTMGKKNLQKHEYCPPSVKITKKDIGCGHLQLHFQKCSFWKCKSLKCKNKIKFSEALGWSKK